MARDFLFKGEHGKMVDELTKEIFPNSKFRFFERNIDIYILAPIVGFQYNRKASVDRHNADSDKKINFDQLNRNKYRIDFNYQLIMLLDQSDRVSSESRIDKAFRYAEVDDSKLVDEGYKKSTHYLERKECDETFLSYLLGGVEVLYEKLVSDANSVEDALNNIHDFVVEFEDEKNLNQKVRNIMNEPDY